MIRATTKFPLINRRVQTINQLTLPHKDDNYPQPIIKLESRDLELIKTFSHDDIATRSLIDAQAAIDRITSARQITSNKKLFNINNRSLITNIIELGKKKNIDLEIRKVKAHAGIWGNEEADTLAKNGLNNGTNRLDIDGS